jgi:dethiobiotin synthetase
MSIFITGTDTSCGKTFISCGILRALADNSRQVIGMKPMATGAEAVDGELRNEDVDALQAASNTDLPASVRNPYLFAPPASPHIVAAQSGVEIELDVITSAFRACVDATDFVVVEGVGGWLVPINETQTVADLAAKLGLPVLLVVGVRLGCINHALLSAHAITASRLPFVGWVANIVEPDIYACDEVIEAVARRIEAPLLGTVAWNDTGALTEIAARLAANKASPVPPPVARS